MCGIAGAVSYCCSIQNEQNRFLRMQKVLTPRGPDEQGTFFSEEAALLHTRLSVVDLKNGKQPMQLQTDTGKYHLVYNGELYNTDEIRLDLQKAGFTFEGHSDTEVVLKAYVEWGKDCLQKFNGIFAFAVYNEVDHSLFLARDRIGVKPLFYAQTKEYFLFASELKAILASGKIDAKLDAEGVSELLFLGPGRTPGCGVFKGVQELKPAHYAQLSPQGFRVERYWSLQDHPFTDTPQQAIETVRFLVTDAIKRQLSADVPVGTFLSGGLDSSIISSIAQQVFSKNGEQLQTFTIDYRENAKYFKSSSFQPNSDADFVGLMQAYLTADAHTVVLDNADLAQALYGATKARDLPGMADVDSSLYLFCKEIKKHVTVALSGECADEIFGGYPWYRDPSIRAIDGFPWAQSTAYRKSFLKCDLGDKLQAEDYVYSRYKDTVSRADTQFTTDVTEKRMKEMMQLNFDWFMQTLLDRKDRMSMANGLEVRVPFCDYRIAEYLYTVPWSIKEYNHFEKGLLRKAMEHVLPPEIAWRKKSPYPKTHHPIYLDLVKNMLSACIQKEDSPLLSLLSKDALTNLLTDCHSTPWYGQLMTTPQTIAYFVQLDDWLRTYNVQIEL